MRTFLIIGAGVTGISAAYHLLKRKAGRVIVLEKDFSGSGSSGRAAGITNTLLWTRTGVQARKISVKLLAEWSRTFPGYHYFNEQGCLGLFSPDGWEERKKLLPLYDEEEVPYEILDPAMIRERWPLLFAKEDFIGLWDPQGGYSEPERYLSALREQVRNMGGELREAVGVNHLLISGSKVTGVATDRGEIPADTVICATYAWTNLLLRLNGFPLPIKSFIHQRYVTQSLKTPLIFPPVNADPLFGYVRPAEGNRILLGVETPDVFDQPVDALSFQESSLAARWDLAEDARKRFEDFLPELRAVTWEAARVGLINFSIDGNPILGAIEGCQNLFVGVGFHSGGFSYSPVSGLLLAELADSGETSISIEEFSPGRYADKAETEGYLNSRLAQHSTQRRRH